MNANRKALQKLLNEAVSQHGPTRVARLLRSEIADSRDNVLTIIANIGGHKIPAKYLRGDVFVASRGNLDLSTRHRVEKGFRDILLKLRSKLLQKSWTKIYLVPTGHPTLSLQLKAAVYGITRISTIDVFYLQGKYFDLEIDLRRLKERE